MKGLNNYFRRLHYVPYLKLLLNYNLDCQEFSSEAIAPLFSDVELKDFVSWLQYHRVEYYLAKFISEKMPHALNKKHVHDISSRVLQAKARSVLYQTTVVNILESLTGVGIPAIVLRGPALASAYYPDPSMRSSRDIDIVVRRSHIPSAHKILSGFGFFPVDKFELWEPKGEWPFTNGKLTVELHWDVYPRVGLSKMQFPDFWNNMDVIGMAGIEANVLNPNHLLLSTCFHLSLEHRFDRLVRLVDIRQILKTAGNNIDWNWINRVTASSALRHVLWQTLYLAQNRVEAKVPISIMQKLNPIGFKALIGKVLFPDQFYLNPQNPSNRLRRYLYFKFLKICEKIT